MQPLVQDVRGGPGHLPFKRLPGIAHTVVAARVARLQLEQTCRSMALQASWALKEEVTSLLSVSVF